MSVQWMVGLGKIPWRIPTTQNQKEKLKTQGPRKTSIVLLASKHAYMLLHRVHNTMQGHVRFAETYLPTLRFRVSSATSKKLNTITQVLAQLFRRNTR